MTWFWVYCAVVFVGSFVYIHWRMHDQVGRRLEEPALRRWRALPPLARWKLRYRLRQGKPVETAVVPLAKEVARAEADMVDDPRATRGLAVVAAVFLVLGIALVILGQPPLGTLFIAWGVFYGGSVALQPILLRRLRRAQTSSS
jgi:hypothetical protein